MQCGAAECLGACVRAGCVTSCLPRTNVHNTTHSSSVGDPMYLGKQSCAISSRSSATQSSARDRVVEGCHPSRQFRLPQVLKKNLRWDGHWAQETQRVINCCNAMQNGTLGCGSLKRGAVWCRYCERVVDSMPAKSENLEASAFISVFLPNLLEERLAV